MKTFLSLHRPLGLTLLAATLSSCSLFKNGKYASQWEIESEVPSSLNSGEATTPSPTTVPVRNVTSNLAGNDPLSETNAQPLEMPTLEGNLVDIPKPSALTAASYQSPPEMLNVPTVSSGHDLPGNPGSTDNSLTSLMSSPPPEVTEEELSMAPVALPPDASQSPISMPSGPAPIAGEMPVEPAGKEPVAPVGPVSAAPAAPGIPLLYGKLDLTPFLTPAPEPEPAQTASVP
jgi:hypothetical protein